MNENTMGVYDNIQINLKYEDEIDGLNADSASINMRE